MANFGCFIQLIPRLLWSPSNLALDNWITLYLLSVTQGLRIKKVEKTLDIPAFYSAPNRGCRELQWFISVCKVKNGTLEP